MFAAVPRVHEATARRAANALARRAAAQLRSAAFCLYIQNKNLILYGKSKIRAPAPGTGPNHAKRHVKR